MYHCTSLPEANRSSQANYTKHGGAAAATEGTVGSDGYELEEEHLYLNTS